MPLQLRLEIDLGRSRRAPGGLVGQAPGQAGRGLRAGGQLHPGPVGPVRVDRPHHHPSAGLLGNPLRGGQDVNSWLRPPTPVASPTGTVSSPPEMRATGGAKGRAARRALARQADHHLGRIRALHRPPVPEDSGPHAESLGLACRRVEQKAIVDGLPEAASELPELVEVRTSQSGSRRSIALRMRPGSSSHHLAARNSRAASGSRRGPGGQGGDPTRAFPEVARPRGGTA